MILEHIPKGDIMIKVKDKLVSLLSLLGMFRGSLGSSAGADQKQAIKQAKPIVVDSKYEVVKSFLSSTHGKAARNTSQT